MVDKTKDINVGGTLHSIATGNIIAHADEVMDEAWGEAGAKQSEINQELKSGAEGNFNNLKTLIGAEQLRAEQAEKKLADDLAAEAAARDAVDAKVKKNTDAIAILNGSDTTAGSVAKSINDAIDSLDVNAIGVAGQYLKTVSETDGKVSATYGQVQGSEVKNTSTKSQISGADTVQAALDALADAATKQNVTAADKSVVVSQNASGTTVKVNIKSDEKVLKLDTTNGLYTNIRVNKLTTPSGENVREEYELLATDGSRLGETIKIYKDQSLKSVEFVTSNGIATGQFLKYVYILANGSEDTVYVDMSELLSESEFGDGLQVSNHVVSAKKDTSSENFLSISSAGIKVSGVQNAINTAVAAEKTRAEEAEADLAESIYYYHASCTLTASPTLIEKGVNATITLTGKSSFMTDGANSLRIENTTASKILTGTGNTVSMTATDTINDTTTFKATAAFDHNVSKTASVTVTAKYPIYTFGSTSTSVTSANITAGTKAVKSSAAGTYSFTLASNLTYFWICVPSEMSVNKVTLSGFDVPMNTPVTVAVDGKGSYKCYRSTNSNDAGTYSLVVS